MLCSSMKYSYVEITVNGDLANVQLITYTLGVLLPLGSTEHLLVDLLPTRLILGLVILPDSSQRKQLSFSKKTS